MTEELSSPGNRTDRRNSIVTTSSMLPHAIRQRIVNKPDWYLADEGWMTIDLSVPQNLAGWASLCPDPSQPLTEIELAERQKSLLKLYGRISDITADVSDIIFSKWIESGASNGYVDIDANEILAHRGLEPLADGSYSTTMKREIAEHINILDNLWISADGVQVYSNTASRRKESKRLVGKYLVKDSFLMDNSDRLKAYPYWWRVAPGTILQPFLRDPNKQFMLMTKRVLSYHPINQQIEKRLARHLIWQFRIRNVKGDYLRPFKNEKMLTLASIKIDRRKPGKFRDRLEKAFDTLQQDGIIVGWQYENFDEESLSRKGWLNDWLSVSVIFEPPTELMYFNERIMDKRPHDKIVAMAETKRDESIVGLRAFLDTKKMNQLVIAEKLGVTRGYLSLILSGKRFPSKSTAAKIMEFLKIHQEPNKK